MAGTAVLGRLDWLVGTVTAVRDETSDARTIELHVPGWPGHSAGQHVDVRLTAPDGYQAVRSYSVANALEGERVELTVEQVRDGEVSPYLIHELGVNDQLEVRGPIGGWFVWRPEQTEHVQLIAGGSGLVPLMAMIRERSRAGSTAEFRLLYSVRNPESVLYSAELQQRASELPIAFAYTRAVPSGWPVPPRRVDAKTIADATWDSSFMPTSYVCGPTAFVETVADLLKSAGHDPARIKTERFGPTGGS